MKIRVPALLGYDVLLETIEIDGELLGTRLHFLEVGASDGRDGHFTRNGVQDRLKGKDYCALDRVFTFVAIFIYQSTRHERTAPLTKCDTRYSDIVCDITGGEEQRMWTEETLEMVDGVVKAFMQMLMDSSDEYCSSGLYRLRYHSLAHIVQDP